MEIPKHITIIGTGNVATHLFKAFTKESTLSPDASVKMINSRTLQDLPPHSDIILIAVKDDVIGSVAPKVTGKANIIAHTSGSVSMDILKPGSERFGVFYPLQTFSRHSDPDYHSIPFFIEGSDSHTSATLKKLAESLSPKVYEADSARRKRLHIAAVFACNFSNHLVDIADRLLKEDGMDYRVLLPLLKETVRKLDTLSPHEAQTGPAVRNDTRIMTSHEEMLAPSPQLLNIYRLLSASIISDRISDSLQPITS